MDKEVTVIVRSSGERTEELCKNLIIEQGVPTESVVIVREAPFSAAMIKSFRTGIERGLPWTMCVDADVLIRPNSIKKLIAIAEKQNKNVSELQGYIIDKFVGGPKQGGIHLYRTSLLEKAISFVPQEGIDIRPEAHTLLKLKENGYPFKMVSYIVGLHDFEQYNKDIFRKSFVHASKHYDWIKYLIDYWRSMAKTDQDFAVALSGLASGIEYLGNVYIDVNQPIYNEVYSKKGFVEKQILDINKMSGSDIEKMVEHWEVPDLYKNTFTGWFGYSGDSGRVLRNNWKDYLHKKVSELGYIRFIIWAIGKAFILVGGKMSQKAERKKE